MADELEELPAQARHFNEQEAKLLVGWVAVIAEVAYVAYKSAKATESLAEWVKDLTDAAAKIGARIREIGSKVEDVIFELHRLVDAVKGRVDRDFFLFNLADMESAIMNIEPYLRDDATITANIKTVEIEAELLVSAINGVLVDKNYSTVIETIGGYAWWVKAHNLLQTFKPAGTRVWVWEHQFNVDYLDTLVKVAALGETEMATLESNVKSIVYPGDPNRAYWTVQGSAFVKHPIVRPAPGPIPPTIVWAPREANQQTLFCSIYDGAWSVYASIPRGGSPIWTHEYRKLDEDLPWERPVEIAAARRLVAAIQDLRAQLAEHKRLVPAFSTAIAEVRNAAVRPAGWPAN